MTEMLWSLIRFDDGNYHACEVLAANVPYAEAERIRDEWYAGDGCGGKHGDAIYVPAEIVEHLLESPIERAVRLAREAGERQLLAKGELARITAEMESCREQVQHHLTEAKRLGWSPDEPVDSDGNTYWDYLRENVAAECEAVFPE